MSRRLATSFAAAALVIALAAPAVSADTGGAPEPVSVRLAQANFSFVDAGIEYSGTAQLEENVLAGTTFVSFYYFGNGAPESCDAGTPGDPTDDYESGDSIEFFATRSKVVVGRIAEDLSSAVVALTLNGTFVRYDGCTSELEARRSERHTFAFALAALGSPTTSEDVFCREDGSGGSVEITERYTSADAGGAALLDRAPVTFTSGSLQAFAQEVGGPC